MDNSERSIPRLTLDSCSVASTVLKSNGIANHASQLDLHLLANSFGNTHGSNPSWLCTSNHAELRIPFFIEELGKLGGLPRSGLTYHNHHLVISNDAHKFFPHSESW